MKAGQLSSGENRLEFFSNLILAWKEQQKIDFTYRFLLFCISQIIVF